MTAGFGYAALLRPRQRAEWSIGIYAGATPFAMKPHPALEAGLALGPRSLGGVQADGVADPFMVRDQGGWRMFFEVENRASGRGEIGLASSADGLAWHFDGIVLKEPFHLSYPHVFQWEGLWYMLPECVESGAVRLYKAASFPDRWELHCELLAEGIADATPFRHDGRWWIIGSRGFRTSDEMVAFHAASLEGPWQPHAANPILRGNRRITRAAGRVIRVDGALVRLTQDYSLYYGRSVRAFRIDELTPGQYRETLAADDVLSPTGSGWNESGMHHMDAHQLESGSWLACVDGRRSRWYLPLWDRLAQRIRRLRARA